jgi:chemotaxis receptor (MCP) glutamine deamidase CheD
MSQPTNIPEFPHPTNQELDRMFDGAQEIAAELQAEPGGERHQFCDKLLMDTAVHVLIQSLTQEDPYQVLLKAIAQMYIVGMAIARIGTQNIPLQDETVETTAIDILDEHVGNARRCGLGEAVTYRAGQMVLSGSVEDALLNAFYVGMFVERAAAN